MIYLDNAATTFIKPPAVYRAVTRAMLSASSPGRGAYAPAMKAAELVYACREAAAGLFHMEDPSRVVITSNATHGLNIAIRSLTQPGTRVLISGFEHNAVTRPLRAAGADVRIAGRKLFDVDELLRDFRAQLPSAQLAVCTHVSNVFGYVLPIEQIAALCKENGVPLIVDASQSAGILDVDMNALGAAFIAMPGHKALFGPQGTGLLLCGQEGVPLMHGGAGFDSASPYMPSDLPERLEAGTMNVPGIAGLLEGLRYVLDRGTGNIHSYEQRLMRDLIEDLGSIRGIKMFRKEGEEPCGILSFTPDGRDCEEICGALGKQGIAVRGGLHCAPLAHESAGTLQCGTVRISLSPFVDASQIEAAADTIRAII